ncbi:DUF6292 family protein [Actinophytocola sp. KF-1]
MDLYFDDDSVSRALRRYVRLVNEALGLTGECWYVQADDAVSAYIALDRRLRRCPDRDVALLWDDSHGWSAAIETHSGEDLLVVAYLGQEVLPAPARVAAWVRDLFDRHRSLDEPLIDVPPVFGPDDGLAARLARYARPGWTDASRPSLTEAGA